MPSSIWIKIVIALFAALVLALSVATGGSLDTNFIRWVGIGSSAVVLAIVAYDRWLWRWPLIRKIAEWTRHPPLLHGTWQGTVRFPGVQHGALGDPVETYLVIDQTYSRIEVTSLLERGSTHALAATVTAPDRNRRILWTVYEGEEEGHRGATRLKIIGSPPTEIQGIYWTNRDTRGELSYTRRVETRYETFIQAREGFARDDAANRGTRSSLTGRMKRALGARR